MYTGIIEGIGPRYCPSIEDKIVRFAEKNFHQIFVEPEGLNTFEVYPNGISTSLPFNVQIEFVRSMKGFENAHLTRPGYAIEYDFFDPRDLKPSLESKFISGLFFAGQINGTTGYEEAAAQGLIAGLNAARFAQEKEPWTPKRHEAYIGVLIDDLITKGTLEPYRMFTSRAEYRLSLREDNADLRLTPIGHQLGLVNQNHFDLFEKKRKMIESEQERIHNTWVRPDSPIGRSVETILQQPLIREYRLVELLRRPCVTYQNLMDIEGIGPGILDDKVAEQIEIQAKYAGYIDRQEEEIARYTRHEDAKLPIHFDYSKVKGLSAEVCQKLSSTRPVNIGMASRIPGVTPAAISLLLVHVKKSKSHYVEHNT